jgi:hypothetical protein
MPVTPFLSSFRSGLLMFKLSRSRLRSSNRSTGLRAEADSMRQDRAMTTRRIAGTLRVPEAEAGMRRKIRRHLGFLFEEAGPTTLRAVAAPGKPQFSVPAEFTPHRYAVFLLHIAAEIEHALMVQYLYAAFSLGGPQVPKDRRIEVEVSQWREIILGIAKEEMGHLMTVQNVLRCLGGPLNLDREDFPLGQ